MMVDWTISGASGETDELATTQLLVYFQIVWTGKIIQRYQIQYKHTCKKQEIPEIYLRKFFWIFHKILGWEREINTAPKPLPEVAPSKMEVAPS